MKSRLVSSGRRPMRSHSSWRSRSTGIMSRARCTISSCVRSGSGTGIDCVSVVDIRLLYPIAGYLTKPGTPFGHGWATSARGGVAQERLGVDRAARHALHEGLGVEPAAVSMDVLAEPGPDPLDVAAAQRLVLGAEL